MLKSECSSIVVYHNCIDLDQALLVPVLSIHCALALRQMSYKKIVRLKLQD